MDSKKNTTTSTTTDTHEVITGGAIGSSREVQAFKDKILYYFLSAVLGGTLVMAGIFFKDHFQLIVLADDVSEIKQAILRIDQYILNNKSVSDNDVNEMKASIKRIDKYILNNNGVAENSRLP